MKSIKVEDWTYRQNESGGIEASHNGIIAQPPASVFKFFSKTRVSDFVKGVFYATHPYQFNDPFECTSNFVSDIDPKFIERLKSELLKQYTEPVRSEIVSYLSDQPKEAFVNFLFRQLGMMSTCSKVDDTRMWGYYNNHEGFAVELDTTKLTSSLKTIVHRWNLDIIGLFPINYVDQFPSIRINDDYVKLNAIALSLIKEKDKWSHENEWRYVFKTDGNNLGSHHFYNWDPKIRQFQIPQECIKSIYLGYKFLSPQKKGGCLTQEEEMMVEYLIEHKDKIKVFQVVAMNDKFCYEPYETDLFLSNGDYYARDWNGEIVKIGQKKAVRRKYLRWWSSLNFRIFKVS